MRASRPQGVGRHITVRRQLLIFFTVAAVTLCVLGFGAIVASRSVAQHQAFGDAERMTSRLADYVVAPLLPMAFETRSDQRRDLDLAIADRLRDGYLVELLAWDRTGKVLWASDPDDVGRTFTVPDEVLAAIDGGVVSSDFTQAAEVGHPGLSPSNEGLVEVYVPFPDGEHPALALEAYFDYARVNATADLILRQMLPLVLIPLLLLQIIQVPIAISLARRVRRQQVERSALLERTLIVSEQERIRIAADLHDGPIQDLAGIGYGLGAVTRAVPAEHQALLETMQDTTQQAIESLRRMMIDLYPPDLGAAQLPQTIADLAIPLRARGILVDVSAQSVPEDLAGQVVTTLFRVGREVLANVAEHARATQVRVVLKMETVDEHHPVVRLDIIDNGIGIDHGRLDRRAEGHLGLRLLRDRLFEQGGSLTFVVGPDGGTAVSAVLPATRSPLIDAHASSS
ncbi:signal transduction histidine kinase [Nakamurella sp. UYEF19]|uniref:sensor histidine kinase n=1 Tax=Nakamurella sp. UYEF19 TaxID=1756392 RepID=UPI00339811F3